MENVALIDRDTGEEVELYDFEVSVLFLEWFAWWRPFCRAAAEDIETGVVEHFREQGGNEHGAPVKHIGLNLQGGQPAQSQNFIDTYHLGAVLNDFDRAFAGRFQTGGQPIFAIINGVQGSPSHRQWELLYSRNGYGNLSQPIETFRSEINRVEPGAGGGRPVRNGRDPSAFRGKTPGRTSIRMETVWSTPGNSPLAPLQSHGQSKTR